MLQTVLPEELRNIILSRLFAKYAGVSEEQLAYELYMTEDQIRTMKRHGMLIGLHGYDHYWLGNLSPEQMRQDISKALDMLDECTGHMKNFIYWFCDDAELKQLYEKQDFMLRI